MTGDLIVDRPIHVKELSDIKQISTGTSHFLALSNSGEVLAMGDDTFGQCGQGSDGRTGSAPFFESKVGKPMKVKLPHKVKKVVCGYRHSFAITENGLLFGWGYNSMQQLSHFELYVDEA